MILSLSFLAIYFIAILLYILCIKDEKDNNINNKGDSTIPFTDGYFAI